MTSEGRFEDISFSDFDGYFRNKTVLVTGHTGFKGSWLCLWLSQLGGKVSGLALDPSTSPNNYEMSRVSELMTHDLRIDIRDRESVASAVKEIQPDVIFHLAAQSIVAYGIENPFETFEVNVMGTASVLEAVRASQRECVVVVVTSDKCYQNTESSIGYTEADPLGGSEPYGASKAAAELVTNTYRETYFRDCLDGDIRVSVASARAGNVIGGGDWSAYRIVPDIIMSLSRGIPVSLRSPDSVRPWQHVLVPLSGYLLLAARMLSDEESSYLAGPWNFGPPSEDFITVREVVEKAIILWGSGSWIAVDNSYAAHETKYLTLKIDKAIHDLGWRPRWDFNRSMERTIAWYQKSQENGSTYAMRDRCLADIAQFSAEP
jgi:CDP-glucose 4,6-dehydratase